MIEAPDTFSVSTSPRFSNSVAGNLTAGKVLLRVNLCYTVALPPLLFFLVRATTNDVLMHSAINASGWLQCNERLMPSTSARIVPFTSKSFTIRRTYFLKSSATPPDVSPSTFRSAASRSCFASRSPTGCIFEVYPPKYPAMAAITACMSWVWSRGSREPHLGCFITSAGRSSCASACIGTRKREFDVRVIRRESQESARARLHPGIIPLWQDVSQHTAMPTLGEVPLVSDAFANHERLVRHFII